MIVRRSHTTVIALCVIAGAAAVAALIHLLLGLLSLDIAVAKTSEEDRQAAQALTQLFENQHPRVRIRTIYEPDRLGTAAALDTSETQLTLVRSDAAPKDGQTLVILRRDAIVFVAPGGSTVDSVAKLKGSTVGLLDGRKLDPRLLDPILTHFGAPGERAPEGPDHRSAHRSRTEPADRFGVCRGFRRQRRMAAAVHGPAQGIGGGEPGGGVRADGERRDAPRRPAHHPYPRDRAAPPNLWSFIFGRTRFCTACETAPVLGQWLTSSWLCA